VSNPTEIFLLDDDGAEVDAPVLIPFFSAVLPALLAKAEEIKIQMDISAQGKAAISGSYRREHDISPLNFPAEFPAFDTFTRVRMFSGMSIVPREKQNGKMILRVGETRVVVCVVNIFPKHHPTQFLKPI
jgi:hypothetical protein